MIKVTSPTAAAANVAPTVVAKRDIPPANFVSSGKGDDGWK
jgi:hypothetical protein